MHLHRLGQDGVQTRGFDGPEGLFESGVLLPVPPVPVALLDAQDGPLLGVVGVVVAHRGEFEELAVEHGALNRGQLTHGLDDMVAQVGEELSPHVSGSGGPVGDDDVHVAKALKRVEIDDSLGRDVFGDALP